MQLPLIEITGLRGVAHTVGPGLVGHGSVLIVGHVGVPEADRRRGLAPIRSEVHPPDQACRVRVPGSRALAIRAMTLAVMTRASLGQRRIGRRPCRSCRDAGSSDPGSAARTETRGFADSPLERAGDKIEAAASSSRGERWSEEVALADMPGLDAIVCGSVAVTRDGRRCGKGEGCSDLEFAILRELGHPPVPVATTCRSCTVVATGTGG